MKKVKSRFKPNKLMFEIAGGFVVAIGIYFLGWGVGSGYISFSALPNLNPGLSGRINYGSVDQVYNLLKSQYDGTLTNSQVLNGLKSGLAASTGDPYTVYYSPSQAKAFNSDLQQSYSGIGAEIGADANNNIEVVSPIANLPAAKAGLLPNDLIIAVNGTSTSGQTIDEVVNSIRGPANTTVTLDILRNGTQHLTFRITRQNFTVPSVTSKILSGNIGYMQISQFTNDTAGLATKAAQNFKNSNVKGVILDLRDNPGGLVDAAVTVSSLWLPGGDTIYQEKHGNTVIDTGYATGDNILKGIPTVVLINDGSASASEITTAALNDNNVAEVIGEKSYGKGVVQEVDNLPGGAELKVTVAKWYRPNGQNIEHIGITPDKTVSMPDSDINTASDAQLTAAIAWIQQH